MSQLTLVDHPVLQRALTLLRRRETPQRVFREELQRASLLLAVEAARGISTATIRIETPLEPTEGIELDSPVVLVPILRAGLTMVDPFLTLIPDARVGHVGLYRDDATHRPVDYYLRLPQDLPSAQLFILDPMLATGGSAVRAIDAVKQAGARQLRFVCLIAAPEGVQRMQQAHPDVPIVCGAVDRALDAEAFIRPGLGDAGDRAFGTEP